jgi:hypothetical protein
MIATFGQPAAQTTAVVWLREGIPAGDQLVAAAQHLTRHPQWRVTCIVRSPHAALDALRRREATVIVTWPAAAGPGRLRFEQAAERLRGRVEYVSRRTGTPLAAARARRRGLLDAAPAPLARLGVAA